MTPYAYWLILAAVVFSWIARDTKNPELALYTQWAMKLDGDLPLPAFKKLEVARMDYAECAEELEAWCAQVDLYQWNEEADKYQQSHRWTAGHRERLKESLGGEV